MTTNHSNPVDGDMQARKQKRNDHSKLAAEIVHNLVSTDSCDEEVTEKLILWVIKRLNKEFPALPSKLLRNADLPEGWKLVPVEPTWEMLSADGCSKHQEGQECKHHENRKRIWKAMLAAAPDNFGKNGSI